MLTESQGDNVSMGRRGGQEGPKREGRGGLRVEGTGASCGREGEGARSQAGKHEEGLGGEERRRQGEGPKRARAGDRQGGLVGAGPAGQCCSKGLGRCSILSLRPSFPKRTLPSCPLAGSGPPARPQSAWQLVLDVMPEAYMCHGRVQPRYALPGHTDSTISGVLL